jgi:cell division cycle protein 20 (cofactor of APC complex)
LTFVLNKSLFFWNAKDNKVNKFCDIGPHAISSLSWNAEGTQIAIGCNNRIVQIWDVAKNSKVNDYDGHRGRVNTVAWGNSLLASSSRDKSILLIDFRENSNQVVSKLEGYEQ